MPNIPISAPQAFVMYLQKLLRHSGVKDPTRYVLYQSPRKDEPEEYYTIKCKECGAEYTQIVCDWNDQYNLDGLFESFMDFAHKHDGNTHDLFIQEIGRVFRPILAEPAVATPRKQARNFRLFRDA